MTMSFDHARTVLRLPLQGGLEPSVVSRAFQKMARRYPVEQFPDKFSELREAYELLSNPVAEIQELMFSSNPDLTSLFPMPPCLNELPKTDVGTKIIREFSVLFRYGFKLFSEAQMDENLNAEGIRDLFGGMNDNEIEKLLERIQKEMLESEFLK